MMIVADLEGSIEEYPLKKLKEWDFSRLSKEEQIIAWLKGSEPLGSREGSLPIEEQIQLIKRLKNH